MRTSDALEYFGGQRGALTALARALNIKPSSVCEWGETVPSLRQLQLERITGGALKADPTILPRKTRRRKAT